MTRIAFSCIKVSKPLEAHFRGVSRPKNYFVYFVYFVVNKTLYLKTSACQFLHDLHVLHG